MLQAVDCSGKRVVNYVTDNQQMLLHCDSNHSVLNLPAHACCFTGGGAGQ